MKFSFYIAYIFTALVCTAQRLEIKVDGRPFTNLYYGVEWAQPFLHPLVSASGIPVSRGYPVERIEGETTDHIWHHGLWFSHGDINGVDFWRDLGPEKTGRMVPVAPPKLSGSTASVRVALVTPDKKTIGHAEELFSVARRGKMAIYDARIAVFADAGTALKFGDTEEGAFGLRLADDFREDRGAVMTNSNGTVGKKIWGQRASWVDYSSIVGGEKLGVLVIEHRSNPRYPTWWHARPYALCSANPFGERDFTKDKTRDGSLILPKGGSLTLRYRVVVHNGGLDAIDPARLQKEYAEEK